MLVRFKKPLDGSGHNSALLYTLILFLVIYLSPEYTLRGHFSCLYGRITIHHIDTFLIIHILINEIVEGENNR
jgi:hypothetical protein